jgi:hypothetical protein
VVALLSWVPWDRATARLAPACPWCRTDDSFPNFEIIVDDLVSQPDAELKSRPLGTFAQVVLWVLRDARRIERFLEHLGAWVTELRRLSGETPEEVLSATSSRASRCPDSCREHSLDRHTSRRR